MSTILRTRSCFLAFAWLAIASTLVAQEPKPASAPPATPAPATPAPATPAPATPAPATPAGAASVPSAAPVAATQSTGPENTSSTTPTGGALVRVERDRAFDRYVNSKLLRNAVKTLEPALLTDLALQFMQGERILRRSHKSLSSEEVLKVAIQAAVAKQDEKALERLTKAVETHENKELAKHLQAARQLSTPSRTLDTGLTVSVESLTPRAFAQYQSTLRYIESKRLRGETKLLEAFRERLPQLKDLGDAERRVAEQHLDAALASLSGGGQNAVGKLTLLSGRSRSETSPTTPRFDDRLYGSWIDGRHLHSFAKTSGQTPEYTFRPLGQAAVTRALALTDQSGVYRIQSAGGKGVYLSIEFGAKGNEITVQRYDGAKYVPYGTWSRYRSSSGATSALSGGTRGVNADDSRAALAAPSRNSSGKYAAIAYSQSTRAHGYSYGKASRAKAEETALDNCAGPDARIVVWTKNGYVALATNSRGAYGWGHSTDKAVAQQKALANCPGGVIKRTVYSGR